MLHFTDNSLLTLWLCGNFTIDTKIFIEHNVEISKLAFGGSVFFGAWAIENFFDQVRYKIFSNGYPFSVSPDNISSLFDSQSTVIDVSSYTIKSLTHYILDYRSDVRQLKLAFFPPGYISLPLKNTFNPHIVLLTPVYHEINEKLASVIKMNFPDAFISCDPQGWCRERDSTTNDIHIREWVPSDEFLLAVAIIKMSLEDFVRASKHNFETFINRILSNDIIFIITIGIKGNLCFFPSLASSDGNCFQTPVTQVSQTGDTTGAGDVWLAAFTISYYQTKNIRKALATATVITGFKIQGTIPKIDNYSKGVLESSIEKHERQISMLSVQEAIVKIL